MSGRHDGGRRRQGRLLLGLAMVLLMLPAGGPARAQAARSIGAVSALIGDCRVGRAGEAAALPLAVGAELFEGDRIRTAEDARLKLEFLDGSVVQLGAGTELTIDWFLHAPEERTAERPAARLGRHPQADRASWSCRARPSGCRPRPRPPRSAAPTGSSRPPRTRPRSWRSTGAVAVRNVDDGVPGEVVLGAGRGRDGRGRRAAPGASRLGRRAPRGVHRQDHGSLIRALRRLAQLSAWRVALLATLAIGSVYLPASRLAQVRQLEAQLLDLRFRLRPPGPPSDAIVLLRDRRPQPRRDRPLALEPHGHRGADPAPAGRPARAPSRSICCWPSRSRGRLPVRALESAAAAAGGAAWGRPPRPDRKRPPHARRSCSPTPQSDARLARRLEDAGRVVLPILFELAPEPAVRRGGAAALSRRDRLSGGRAGAGRAISRRRTPAARPLLPIARLGAAAATLGHANVPLDQDGAARSELPAIGWREAYYPSFALEVARLHLGVERDQVRLRLGRGIVLGERFVPTDESMRMPVNYRGAQRFATISAADLMRGAVDPARLAGRIVLIGGTAAGVGESFASPFSRLTAGHRAPRHGDRQHPAAGFPQAARGERADRPRRGDPRRPADRLARRPARPARRQPRLRGVPGRADGDQPLRLPRPRLVAQPVPAARRARRDLSAGRRLRLLRRAAPGAPHTGRLQALSEPDAGRPGRARPRAAPARRRAEGADRAVRRHPPVDRARRGARAEPVRAAPQRGLQRAERGPARAWRHARQVRRRRPGGGVRSAAAAARPCAARLPRGARDAARASRRCARAGRGPTCRRSRSASASTPAA